MKNAIVNPLDIVQNPWNSNVVSPDNERKLDASINRLGMFKPLVVRRIAGDKMQVLGGAHRLAAAIRLGMTEVPVIDLGKIDDKKAKEISVVDNGRYGTDDATRLADLLKSLDADKGELEGFVPFSGDELTAIFASSSVSIEDLGFEDEHQDPLPTTPKPVATHQIMRFKVPVEDAETVSRVIEKIIRDQGLSDSDSLINAGDALVHLSLKGV